MRACMLIVRPGTCWNRVGRTVRFFAYYFYARAWCEVCGPSASFDAEELRVGFRWLVPRPVTNSGAVLFGCSSLQINILILFFYDISNYYIYIYKQPMVEFQAGLWV